MSTLAATLPKAWWAFELPGYRNRPQRATYSLFDYEALPPIQEILEESFQWLWNTTPQDEEAIAGEQDELDSRLDQLLTHHDMALPPDFVAFMRSSELQSRVRSCTACYLELPVYPIRIEGEEAGWLIHFLSDQQYCLHWNLLVSDSGDNGVVASGEAYGMETTRCKSAAPVNLTQEAVWSCASSFSEFLYRFWIENEIWFALASEKKPLTPKQQAYVEHYRKLALDE